MFPWTRPATMKQVHPKRKIEEDIVKYVRSQKLIKHESDTDFVVEEVVVESERINRRDYINSFRDDVGIENILKKLVLTGDTSVLNVVKRESLPILEDGKEAINDIVPLQEVGVEALGDSMRAKWAALPDALKKGRSLEEFLQQVNDAEIYDFIKGVKEAKEGSGGDDNGTK